ncbi:MAG TPA: diaminopimelate epimerase [Candidatus Kapabacteria bacterium]|nr:diaminopimelate epimerase [Candidatus Kapabacteria bacterium]
MTHSFQRYTAAGNTFVVMNTWEDPLSLHREEMRALVQNACDYKNGIGADGVILINQPHSPLLPAGSIANDAGVGGVAADFRMDFYNPDGTTGMLCGNGARCAVLAACTFGYTKTNRTRFEVLGAINHSDILNDGNIRVFFQDPTVIRLNSTVPLEEEKNITVSYVDLGSQHVVIFFDQLKQSGLSNIEEFNIAHYGSLVRWHPEFAPVGANANFIEVREDGEEKYLRIRTFERGVEGETLACGTGCMSAAIVARMTGRITQMPVRLLTQSGEFVTVNFSIHGDRVSNLSLEGNVIAGEEGTLSFDEETKQFDVEYI